MSLKEIYVTAWLTDGNWALCKFTSDEAWIPVNANVSIKPGALPHGFSRLEFKDANGTVDAELITTRTR